VVQSTTRRGALPHNPGRPIALLGLGLWLIAGGGLPASTHVASRDVNDQLPTFRSTTEIVAIDAFVTNSQGRFVSDLSKSDFAIMEDGQPRPVESLELVDLRQDGAAHVTAATPGSGVRGRLHILVIDDLHIASDRSPAARRIADGFIKSAVRPGDQATLVFSSGAAGAPEPTSTLGTLVAAANRMVGRRQMDAGAQLDAAVAAIATLTAAVETAARVKDLRKALVLISEGFDAAHPEARSRMAALVAAANRSNVSIYTFDPRGAAGSLGGFASSNTAATALLDEERRSQDYLRDLSAATDGHALVNSWNLSDAFARIQDDTSRYYLIGFRPGSATGHEAQVRVHVSRPDLTVRARRTFTSTPTPVQNRAPVATPPAEGPPSLVASPAVELSPVPPLTPTPEATIAPAADVAELIRRAGLELERYAGQLSLVVGIERYAQYMSDQQFSRAYSRSLVSEFALVRVKDDWLGFRDVFEVDGKPVGDRQDRLAGIFLKGMADAVTQSRKLTEESARYNLGAMQRNFNVPTMALFFVQPANAGRFRFRKDGVASVNGTDCWRLRYDETKRPTIIRTSAGKDMPVSGALWIDPRTGAIHKTQMELSAEATIGGTTRERDRAPWDTDGGSPLRRVKSTVSISVTYKTDPKLGILVPAEMIEIYEGPALNRFTGAEGISKVNSRATYSDFKRFETSATLTIPK
jgi:VWFA-related protein